MSNTPKKIGEGSYGCAYRPAIPCSDQPNTDIDQKISKVLNIGDANNEYAEYVQIAKADPKNEYYLGKPQKCTMSEANYNAFVKKSGCQILQPKTTAKDYRLLQYLDGGSDLDDFAHNHLTKFLSTWPQRQSDYFWLNAHKLFMGLKQFAENNVIHDDLKPQNIVFKFDLAKDTMDFNYIDFGLARNLSSLRMNVAAGYIDRSFHWSRPMEQGFASNNYNLDNYLLTSDDNIIKHFTNEFFNIIIKNQQNNIYDINPGSFYLLHEYVEDSLNPNTTVIVKERIKSCMQGIIPYRKDLDTFCRKSINTTDTYALGFTLNHVANKMHNKGAIPDNEYIRYHQFFEKLFDFNLFTRWDNIDMIISEYESVLELNGVLQRLGKRFVNHKVEKKDYTNIVKAVIALTRKQAIEVGALSPKPSGPPNLKPCPPGKVRNPTTKRCNKVKSPGKTKRIVVGPKRIVPCAPDKERNPKTGRCVKTCPPDKIRRNGRCVKEAGK
jgi:serine/threonine protein kinase